MPVYKFFAIPKNGIITIPEQYKNKASKKIKVILLDKNIKKSKKKDNTVHSKSNLLIPPSLDTLNWKFNREEANER